MNELIITAPDTVVAQAATHFAVAPSDLHPMVGGHATAVYQFVRDGSAYVLRVLPPSDETRPADVRAIQAWVSYLADQGAPVPVPLSTVDGHDIIVIERPEGAYTIMASEKARGIRAETLSQASWTDAYYQNLGGTAATLHNAAAGFRPAPDLRRPDILSNGSLFSLDQPATTSVTMRKQEVLTTLGSLPKPPAHFGMIHGDFHFGNFFVDPDDDYALTVFDFDDCGYGWYLMDTATLLFDLTVLYDGDDREAFAAHFLHHYLHRYHQVRPIDPAWLAQLPHFLKLLEISYYAMLAPAYGAGEDGDWWVARFMPQRQSRVEANVPYLDLNFDRLASDLA